MRKTCNYLKQRTVKTLKHTLWAFLATAVLAGCSDDLTYTPGDKDNPDNYGVYFPTQTSPTTVELDPAVEPTVTYKVRRSKILDAITVPVEVTTSEEGIFEIQPITFGPGEEETQFTVSFPNAVEGTEYTCDIRIVDPAYVSLYSTRSTVLSFKAIRAGWELVTRGEATKGKWRDDMIGNMYGLNSSSFNPTPEIEVEIYQRRDLPGYYRMKVYGQALVTAMTGGPTNIVSRDLWTIVDARDPNKVFIPYQSTGLTLVDEDGEVSIASSVTENFLMDEAEGQYGTMQGDIITFPAESILCELSKNSGMFFHCNRNGMLRIQLPGVVIPDYTVTLSKSEPADGAVDITATLKADVGTLKFAVLEGALDEGQAALAGQELHDSQKFDGKITESGTIRVENRKTGKYTLVGCIYDKAGGLRDFVSVSFGYIAKDDDKPVILTMGLEGTNEFAGQGISTDNSVKFYAYGEGIESVTFGLYRSQKLASLDPEKVLDDSGSEFTADQLKQLNEGHFSELYKGLNGGSEYTLLLRAYNGYVHKLFTATFTTTGTFNPGLEFFTYSDFLPKSQQPRAAQLEKTWNYYAINLMESTQRRKIGEVTISLDPDMSSINGTIMKVRGLSGIQFEEGGDLFGAYMPTADVFNGDNGALALYTGEAETAGIYNDTDVITAYMPNNSGGMPMVGYGMYLGAVADGYLYCVPSQQVLSELGYLVTGLITFSADGYTLYSYMTEMMLVDPAKDMGGIPGAALERMAEMRRKAWLASTPRNLVELPEFSTAAGATVRPEREMPVNYITTPMQASAPKLKHAGSRITILPAAPAEEGATDGFRKMNLTSVKLER